MSRQSKNIVNTICTHNNQSYYQFPSYTGSKIEQGIRLLTKITLRFHLYSDERQKELIEQFNLILHGLLFTHCNSRKKEISVIVDEFYQLARKHYTKMIQTITTNVTLQCYQYNFKISILARNNRHNYIYFNNYIEALRYYLELHRNKYPVLGIIEARHCTSIKANEYLVSVLRNIA